MHGRLAMLWLKATVASASATLLATIVGLITAFFYHPAGTPATIQYVVAKLLVISTLSFAVFWSARNYKAQKHNENPKQAPRECPDDIPGLRRRNLRCTSKRCIVDARRAGGISGRPTGYAKRLIRNLNRLILSWRYLGKPFHNKIADGRCTTRGPIRIRLSARNTPRY